MSTGSAADGEASARGRAARSARRVVVSSVTGKPIDWEAQDAAASAASARRTAGVARIRAGHGRAASGR